MKGVARAGKGTAEFVTAQEDRLQSKVHSTEVNAVWSTLTCYSNRLQVILKMIFG